MFNKVVYVRYLPLTKAIYTDLYFEELIKNNIEVDYLDLTYLFFPDQAISIDFNFPSVIKIENYKQLKTYLNQQNINKTLYISIMTFEWRLFKLFRLFTKLNLTLGVFARGVFPNSAEPDHKSKVLKAIKTLSFKAVISFLVNKITFFSKKNGLIKPYDYIFKAGELGYQAIGTGCEIDFQRAKIIEVNTVDYDQFLLHSKVESVQTEENIVFLDQYLPYHPDVSYFNINTVAAEPYFKELNNFFDKLELETGNKVIIAAHPKAEKYKDFNPFNNRPIFFNQSNDLVKNAAFVLTHASTAICFPICYQKKIVLLMSEYLTEIFPQYIPVVNSIVKSCGASLIMMDTIKEAKISDEINFVLYEDYKYKYLTSKQSEQKLSVDIFINFTKTDQTIIN